jgi:hypothetical protein
MNNMQRDLFQSASGTSSRLPQNQREQAFLERYRLTLRLDQVLVGVIGLLVLYAMVFSVGVENGKRIERRKYLKELPQGIVSVDAPAGRLLGVEPVQAESAPQSETSPAEGGGTAVPPEGLRIRTDSSDHAEVASEKPAGNFTIQIITYKTQAAADRHVQALTSKGLKAFAVRNGEYLTVCVDAFESQQKAKSALKQMKSQGVVPADAYVRNFPRQALA